MARSMERRASGIASVTVLAAFALVALQVFRPAFVPPVQSSTPQSGASAAATAGTASSLAILAGAPLQASANENVIELGGGFAINLDIPETGIVNIAILIAGLIYLLGPVLSESMATREKEIQQDIDDAIAKYDEACSRLAEAEKNQAQADQVIAEIEASIQKDKDDFQKRIEAACEKEVKEQAAAAEQEIKTLNSNVDIQVETYIQLEAIKLGAREAKKLSDAQKAKILNKAIELL
mmetsp:Transcript_3337/g.8323  ORF Transcript_3337/g.8323 Transcript_3337/m.8323 type:complete len:237 (+) Transcript_3337:70-780(+)